MVRPLLVWIVAAGVTLAVVGVRPEAAEACVLLGLEPHKTDAREKKLDRTPPGVVAIGELAVHLGSPHDWNDCGSTGKISFAVSARDDRTPPEKMGYLVELVGSPPPGGPVVEILKEPVRALDGRISLDLRENEIDAAPIDVTLQVTAVDLAGHRSSAPIVVHAVHDGLRVHRPALAPADAGEGCRRKQATACTWQGKQYRHGTGVAADMEQAKRFYTLGCKYGDALACEYGAELHRTDRRAAIYSKVGRALLARALKLHASNCDKKDADACQALAHIYLDGRGVAMDRERAQRAMERACDAGNADICNFAAFWWLRRGNDRQRQRAAEIWSAECDHGDGDSCAKVARLHDRGENGLARDAAQAARRYGQACRAGKTKACVQAGWRVLASSVDDPGRQRAANFFEQACKLGEGKSVCELARASVALMAGASVSVVNASIAVYEQACQDGGWSCVHLARLYETGTLVAEDAARAATFRRRACDHGQTESCILLGDAIRRDAEDAPALGRAADEYALGCQDADETACLRLGEVCERLRTQIPAAEEHRGACHPKTPGHFGYEQARAYEHACEQGSLALCVPAAGHFAENDLARARKLLARACKLGDARSCTIAEPGFSVSGQVTAGDGQPALAGLVIVVSQPGDHASFCVRRGTTDAKGRFEVAGACPGAGELRAYAPGQEDELSGLLAHATFEGRRKRVAVGVLPALVLVPIADPNQRGTLGVRIVDSIVQDSCISRSRQLRIEALEPDGPMAQAGFEVGDRILAVDGRHVGPPDYDWGRMHRLVQPEFLRPGQTLRIRVRREDVASSIVHDVTAVPMKR